VLVCIGAISHALSAPVVFRFSEAFGNGFFLGLELLAGHGFEIFFTEQIDVADVLSPLRKT
jgi:hypothetical protein